MHLLEELKRMWANHDLIPKHVIRQRQGDEMHLVHRWKGWNPEVGKGIGN